MENRASRQQNGGMRVNMKEGMKQKERRRRTERQRQKQRMKA